MSKINYKNVEKNLCVMCNESIKTVSFIVCQKCNAISQFDYKIVGTNTVDIKSICCNSGVNVQQKITCSDLCHFRFVEYVIEEKGKYQKVIDVETGKTHRVPRRLIIEEGLTQPHLKEFPEWRKEYD